MRKSNNQGVGLLFIAIGVILLISKLDFFHQFFNFDFPFTLGEVFRSMISLWPITLIVIGLNIILNRHTMLKIVLWASFIVVLILYSSYGSRFERLHFFIDPFEFKDEMTTEQISKETFIYMENAVKGELKIDLGACNFKAWGIGSETTRTESNIRDLNVISQYDEKESKIIIKIEDEDKLSELTNKKRFTDVELSTQVPWDITAEIGAINAEFNLKKIKVDKFNVDVGAGNVELYLGEENAHSDIYVNGGASNVKIFVPEDCGVKVIKYGNLINFSDHFGLKEDLTSENYNDADTVFDFYLNANAANVELFDFD